MHKQLHTKAYAAEFIGTFMLALSVLAFINGPLSVATPLAAALVVGLFVYTVGTISGAHFNPAVTLAMLSVKKIKLADAVLYIIAQLLAALLAYALFALMLENPANVVPAVSKFSAVAEAVGAFVLVFGISSVAYGKTHSAASGLVIGGSLLLGILLAVSMNFSAGILNPALAFSMGSLSLEYLLAPIVGGMVAVWSYKFLVE